MPEKWILTDVTDAKRATANIKGSDGSATGHMGARAHALEQDTTDVKPTRKRRVHFLLPGSQTHVDGPASLMDGANERETNITILASQAPDIETKMSTETSQDVISVMEASKFDKPQAMVSTDGGDNQGPITESPQSAKEHVEDVAMMEAPEATISGPVEELITEPERPSEEHDHGRDAAMMMEGSVTATSTLSPGLLDEGDSSVALAHNIHDTTEDIKVPDGTVDSISFYNAPFEDRNKKTPPEQQYIDSTLPGGSCERPIKDIHEKPILKRQYDDVAPLTTPLKRPLEVANEQRPAKRQRIDAASKSNMEQSIKNGEQSREAVSQRETPLISDGDATKFKPVPRTVATASVPNTTDWSKFTVANLRKELSKRGLSSKGIKTLLVQRLTDFDMTQAMSGLAEEEGNGGPALVESQSKEMVKDNEVGQISEGPTNTVRSPENDASTAASAAARDRDWDVENLVEGIVDHVIFGDDVDSANLFDTQAMGRSHIEQPHECNDYTATAGSSAEKEIMQDDLQWQDDTCEEVVLLTIPDPMPDPSSPRAERPVQRDGDADISLESVEAPAIEPGVHDGTPPRFTGSGTIWTRVKEPR